MTIFEFKNLKIVVDNDIFLVTHKVGEQEIVFKETDDIRNALGIVNVLLSGQCEVKEIKALTVVPVTPKVTPKLAMLRPVAMPVVAEQTDADLFDDLLK
jgi:hypothetical protein